MPPAVLPVINVHSFKREPKDVVAHLSRASCQPVRLIWKSARKVTVGRLQSRHAADFRASLLADLFDLNGSDSSGDEDVDVHVHGGPVANAANAAPLHAVQVLMNDLVAAATAAVADAPHPPESASDTSSDDDELVEVDEEEEDDEDVTMSSLAAPSVANPPPAAAVDVAAVPLPPANYSPFDRLTSRVPAKVVPLVPTFSFFGHLMNSYVEALIDIWKPDMSPPSRAPFTGSCLEPGAIKMHECAHSSIWH